jgi:hypothetical protein
METNVGSTLTYGRQSGAGGGKWREEGGEYIASHTITYEYIITDDPHHGLLLLISPRSGENSLGLYFSLL